MQKKYDKFLFSYAVAKRAKELMEEGVHYLEEKDRDKRPIMEATKEILQDKVLIEITDNKHIDLKEEEDTLDGLYENLKLPEELQTDPQEKKKPLFNIPIEDEEEPDDDEVLLDDDEEDESDEDEEDLEEDELEENMEEQDS